MKALNVTSLFVFASFAFATAFAQIASDNASNYGGGWTNGTNQGSGFAAWDLSNNNNNGSTIFSGYFIGDATAGAGDINTSGNSFGIYANPGSAFATASRAFSSPLSVGQTFSVDLGVNFDNGNKGFNLLNGSQGEIFNFNVGSGASVSSSNGTINPNTAVSYDYGGAAAIQLQVTVDSASQISYSVSRSSPQGLQGTLFDGTVTGLTSTPSAFALYNSGTDNGDAQNNLYFNNLGIIPEPAMAMLFMSGLGLIYFLRRRK